MKLISRVFQAVLVLVLMSVVLLPFSVSAENDGSLGVTSVPIDKVREHYKGCLSEKEMDELIRLKKELEDMERFKALDPKAEIQPIIKDDKATDFLCDQLPDFLKGIAYSRELGKEMDKVRNSRYKRTIADGYWRYMTEQVDVNGCHRYTPLDEHRHGISQAVAKSTGQTWKGFQGMFLRAAKKYCFDMENLRDRIAEYENRCVKVPNLVGLSHDKSIDVTAKIGLNTPLIQQPEFRNLADYDKKAPLVIYKQDPEAGPNSWCAKGFAIKTWVRNDLKSLKADPPSWLNAKVGDSKSFVITAELVNGRKVVTMDKDCKWSVTDTNVVEMTSVKGTARAVGPGKAEILALYDHHDGEKLASHVVRIPVTVLAPPKPKRKLTSFKLTPPSVVDITIGGSPVQLTGVATFSDKPGQKLDVTKDCKPWTSDGAPDLTVKGGLVTAHSAKLAQSKHVIHAAYTYDGQTMKDAVQFRILGAGSSPGTGSGSTTTQTPAEYVKLSLSKTDVTMDLQSQESIRATALYSKIPQFIPKDVTFDPDITWSSSDPSIAEFVNGVITSKKTVGSCVITATFSPAGAKKPLAAQCKVTVAGAPLVVDFEVSPRPGPYKPGDKLTFTETIKAQNRNQYDLTWYVAGRVFTQRSSIEYTFKSPGRYQVRLVAKHRVTGVEDALAKNIDVEHPDDLDVRIEFRPETNLYAVGANVGFVARVSERKGITEYRWYVAGEYVGSGQDSVKHKFTEDGEYEIKLGLRMGSNFDEMSVIRPLIVGEPGIGTLGRERNRFEAVDAPDQLKIRSSYWKGGTAEWSKPVLFNGGNIGAVDHYILHNGNQADGYNTGFLVYVPRGRNNIQFKVLHFSWADREGRGPHGKVHYSGSLPLHGKTIVPESVRFTRKASRMCDVEWRTEDGSSCRARINKFKKSGKIRYSGMDDLGCDEDVYPPIDESDTDVGTGELQLPFSDDFSSGLRNWNTQYMKPELSGGKLYWNDPAHRPMSTKKTIPFENVVIEFDAWCEKDGLPVRWENERGEGYLVVLGSWLNTRSLSGHGPGNVETVFGKHIVFKEWQRYRIVRQGDTLKASIDGTEVLSRKITTRYAGRGTLRFHSYSRVGIDNVRISRASDEDDDEAGGTGKYP